MLSIYKMYWNDAILIYVFQSLSHHQLETANIPQKAKTQSENSHVTLGPARLIENNRLNCWHRSEAWTCITQPIPPYYKLAQRHNVPRRQDFNIINLKDILERSNSYIRISEFVSSSVRNSTHSTKAKT